MGTTTPQVHAQEGGKCNNGGCTRPVYRGRECFRCWAGTKWTSICQRIENKNGNNNAYAGIPVGFTKDGLIQWIMDNPPPSELTKPSIDRIENSLGYSPGNIQWLEFSRNCSRRNKDTPDGFRSCSKCLQLLHLSVDNFPHNGSKNPPFGHYCKPCNRTYQKEWANGNNSKKQ
jgi:hypothetical protein